MSLEDDWKTAADWASLHPQLIDGGRSEEDLDKELIKQSKARGTGVLFIRKRSGFHRSVVLSLLD